MNEVWQDRIPPQNIEAEQAVLGSVFLDAETIIDAMEYIDALRAFFCDRDHCRITVYGCG